MVHVVDQTNTLARTQPSDSAARDSVGADIRKTIARKAASRNLEGAIMRMKYPALPLAHLHHHPQLPTPIHPQPAAPVHPAPLLPAMSLYLLRPVLLPSSLQGLPSAKAAALRTPSNISNFQTLNLSFPMTAVVNSTQSCLHPTG